VEQENPTLKRIDMQLKCIVRKANLVKAEALKREKEQPIKISFLKDGVYQDGRLRYIS
jgi:hypothetical protein